MGPLFCLGSHHFSYSMWCWWNWVYLASGMACDSSLASHTGVAEKKVQFFHRGLLRRKDAVLNDAMSTQPEIASLVAEMIKNLPAMQETWVRSLSQKDPTEKELATHSSILAWRILWTEKSGELATVHGITKSWTRLSDSHFPSLNPYVHISVLYVCISIPALEIGSSVLFPCGILVPGWEIESAPPAVEAQSRYHRTSRVVPCIYLRHSSTLQAWR